LGGSLRSPSDVLEWVQKRDRKGGGGVKGKKPSKKRGKKKENMPTAHVDASIPAGNRLVSFRKQHV
jgi:hypothetical protein